MTEVTILLVEDEASLADFVAEELRFEGYQVLTARDGAEALALFEQQENLTLILLDWMLPVYDGLTVARRIRQKSQIPIIMMTARDQLTDKVAGLDGGSDDYLTKPFEIEELLARIRVILRREVQRQALEKQPVYRYQDLSLDLTKHTVERAGQTIQLTQKEFGLLLALMKHPEEVLTRDALLNEVWGYEHFGQTNVVDVHIRSLRNKLDYQKDRQLLQTVRGVGYVLRRSHEN